MSLSGLTMLEAADRVDQGGEAERALGREALERALAQCAIENYRSAIDQFTVAQRRFDAYFTMMKAAAEIRLNVKMFGEPFKEKNP